MKLEALAAVFPPPIAAANAAADRFGAAVDCSGDAILIVEPDSGCAIDANEAAGRLFGCALDGLIGAPVPGLGFQEDGSVSKAEVYPRIVGMHPAIEVSELSLRSEGRATVHLERRRCAFESGGTWLVYECYRDITQRRATQRHLGLLVAAMNDAADAIIVIDPQALCYVDVNEAAARLYGMTRQAMLERGLPRVLEELGWQGGEDLSQRYRELIAQYPEATTTEDLVELAGGSTLILESKRRAVQLDGEWLIITVSRDVTEQRAQQQRLLWLRAAINDATDSVTVIDPENLAYVDINEAAGKVYGIPAQVMMAKGFAWVIRELGMSPLPKIAADYARMIANYPAVETEVIQVPGPGGSVLFVEVKRRAVSVEGKWLIVSIGRDVTQKLAEQRRLEQMNVAINEAGDAIVVIDPELMQYLDVNEAAARMYGLTRQELLERGLPWTVALVGVRSLEAVRQHSQEIIDAHPDEKTEVYPVPRPPGIIMVETSRRAVRVDGRWLIVSISRDVTEHLRVEHELKRQAEDLARSNADLQQFAYVASHDLSEPLRMVAGYTQLLERRYKHLLDEDGKDFMGFIVSGAQRMRQLIDDLLTYSKSGRPDPAAMVPQSLDAPLKAALQNLEHAIVQSGARIERPAPLPAISCDRIGMTQLFQNLIGNALKFKGEAAPVVKISAEREGTGWTISVADNGIGIEAAYHERIFVIFQRLHPRTAYDGTGIGLAICKRIVERHRGRIWVESNAGAGTTFKFNLPDTSLDG